VHIIVRSKQKLVEIQVRTALQHSWAELSEKWSDLFDPAIKYGGGPEWIRRALTAISDTVAKVESVEDNVAISEALLAEDWTQRALPNHQNEIAEIRARLTGYLDDLRRQKETLARLMRETLLTITSGETDAISN
jgi:hypothetical protein